MKAKEANKVMNKVNNFKEVNNMNEEAKKATEEEVKIDEELIDDDLTAEVDDDFVEEDFEEENSFKKIFSKLGKSKKTTDEAAEEDTEKTSFYERMLEKKAIKAQKRVDEFKANKALYIGKRAAVIGAIGAGIAGGVLAYKNACAAAGLDSEETDDDNLIEVEATEVTIDPVETEAPSEE